MTARTWTLALMLFALGCEPERGRGGTGMSTAAGGTTPTAGETTTRTPDQRSMFWFGATRDPDGRVLLGGQSTSVGMQLPTNQCPVTLSAESGGPFTVHHIDDGAPNFVTMAQLGATFLGIRGDSWDLTPQGVYRSADGVVWEHVLETESYTVIVVDDLALVVGPLDQVSTSTDGSTWSSTALPGVDPDRNYRVGITHTTELGFVATDIYAGPIAHSADGFTWDATTVTGLPAEDLLFEAPLIAGGRLVMTVVHPGGAHGDDTYSSLVSSDGIAWTHVLHQDVEAPGVAFAGKFWRMHGDSLYSSVDGTTWVEGQVLDVGSPNGLLADGDRLLAYGYQVWSSTDGVTWGLERDNVDRGPCAD